MQIGIWIFLAGLLGFVALEFVRGTRIGKKEQKRLQELFKRITECACPFCGRTYGSP
jgi:hypothetical protein